MNNEVIKAMNRKPKAESKFRKWWKKNSYKVYRVIFFPIWIWAIIYKKVEHWVICRNSWSEERAKEIFNYYVPRFAKWDKEENEFFFFDNGYGWSINLAKKHLKRKDRAFWKCNIGWGGGKMREYLLYHFELEGFTKEVLNDDCDWTEIVFKLKK